MRRALLTLALVLPTAALAHTEQAEDTLALLEASLKSDTSVSNVPQLPSKAPQTGADFALAPVAPELLIVPVVMN